MGSLAEYNTEFGMGDRYVAAQRMSRIMRHVNPPSAAAALEYGCCVDEVVASSTFGSNLGDRADEGAMEEGEAPAWERKRVILVVGAGDATGGAVAKRFAREGYVACLVRRNANRLDPLAQDIVREGGEAHAFGVDARKEDQVVALVEQIERDVGDIRVLVFNIGANVKFSILETTSRVYQKVWEMACLAGFLAGREVAKRMVARETGTIIFTGATASVRGGSGYAAFAGAKFGLRALAQSMARELGPKGIHVAHVVVDAAIDTPWTRGMVADPASLSERQGMVSPQDIGEMYWQIHRQPKTAWSHEMDLRPWIETW